MNATISRPGTPRIRPRVLGILTACLVAWTALRMLVLCLAQPIAAYGNNYDFLRQSSCVGVWEAYSDREKTAPYPARPVNALIYDGDRKPGLCMRSSDNVFLWAAAHIAGRHAPVQLRMVGLLRTLAALGMLLFLVAQPIAAPLRLAISVVAACVLGDFALLLYFNTLYLDASIFISAFAALALVVTLYCRKQRPGIIFLAVLGVTLAWLGFARQQYAPFAGLLGLFAALMFLLRWRDARLAGALLVGTILTQAAIYILAGHISEHTRQIDKANRVDTFLGAVLPAAANRVAAVALVGLPPECEAAVGKDWYSPGFQTENPCPAVYTANRLRLLPLFMADPNTLWQPISHAIDISRPALLPYLGHFERPEDAARFRFRMLDATSLSTWVAMLGDSFYRFAVYFVCSSGPVLLAAALLRACMRRERGGDNLGATLMLSGLGGTLAFYALFSSVFGDGYGDIAHHTLGMLIGASFMAAATITTMPILLGKITNR